MGEKISDYINSASATPNSQSLLDLSEFNGSTYESVKWELSDFLTWLTNNVSFSEVYTFYNNSGATLEKGTPVKIDSLQSGVVAVNDYQLLPNNASSQIFVAKEQILNGAQGVFFKAGIITDVDTSTFSVGQTIYYNYTTNIITNVYGSDVIYLGIVITSAVSGSIFVAPEKAESVSSNIYSSDGTLTANRIMDGANNELLFQTMGKFSVHSHANGVDNIVLEVRSDAVYHSFIIKDHNTGVHILACRNGAVEISDAYFLPSVDGSANQIVKTDGSGQWGYGIIQDNGTNVGIGGNPDGNLTKQLFVQTSLPDGVFSINNRTLSGATAGTFWTNGVNTFTNKGAYILCQNSQNENIGLHIVADDNGQGGANYGIWIQDGSQANGRFLQCDTNGKANWSDIAVSDVTNLQSNLDSKTDKLLRINNRTTSSTLALTDADDLVVMDVATANNLTIPANSSVAFPIGTQIIVKQLGAGATTFVADTGVTIHSFNNLLTSAGQYCIFTLIKVDGDVWSLTGNLV